MVVRARVDSSFLLGLVPGLTRSCCFHFLHHASPVLFFPRVLFSVCVRDGFQVAPDWLRRSKVRVSLVFSNEETNTGGVEPRRV